MITVLHSAHNTPAAHWLLLAIWLRIFLFELLRTIMFGISIFCIFHIRKTLVQKYEKIRHSHFRIFENTRMLSSFPDYFSIDDATMVSRLASTSPQANSKRSPCIFSYLLLILIHVIRVCIHIALSTESHRKSLLGEVQKLARTAANTCGSHSNFRIHTPSFTQYFHLSDTRSTLLDM